MGFFSSVGRSFRRTFRRGPGGLFGPSPKIPEVQAPAPPPPLPEQAIFELGQERFRARRRAQASTLLTGPAGLLNEPVRARRKTLLGE